MDCYKCHIHIDLNQFYFICNSCDTLTCGNCGIDADTECPKCGGCMQDYNEDK